MTRRWILAASLFGHVTLAFGLFAAGVWNIERLPAGRHTTAALAVMSPPAPMGGGALAATKVEVVRRIVHDPTQPVPKLERVAQVPTTSAPATDPGTGSGDGSGSGTDPTGTGECLTPPCGLSDLARAEPPRPPDPPKPPAQPAIVPPKMLDALRIAGETAIRPPSSVASAIQRDGKDRVVGGYRVCVSTSGDISSVTLAVSTGYPAYDAALAEGIRTWRYRPYLVNGQPAPVCGHVTFIYAQH